MRKSKNLESIYKGLNRVFSWKIYYLNQFLVSLGGYINRPSQFA